MSGGAPADGRGRGRVLDVDTRPNEGRYRGNTAENAYSAGAGATLAPIMATITVNAIGPGPIATECS